MKKDIYKEVAEMMECELIRHSNNSDEDNNIAMIFSRGHNQEEQVRVCDEYAELKGYDVIGEINDDTAEIFSEIGNIDILLVSDFSRISRDSREFIQIAKALAADGIRIEAAK